MRRDHTSAAAVRPVVPTAEAARRLKVSRPTILNWIHAGTIPRSCVEARGSRKPHFYIDEAWVAAREQKPPPPLISAAWAIAPLTLTRGGA